MEGGGGGRRLGRRGGKALVDEVIEVIEGPVMRSGEDEAGKEVSLAIVRVRWGVRHRWIKVSDRG